MREEVLPPVALHFDGRMLRRIEIEEKKVGNMLIPLHGAHVNTPKFVPTDFEPHIAHE